MLDNRLELRDHDAAFERIEAWLSSRGFFAEGADDLVADLYLGYGLSQSIRRETSSPPLEPCLELPLAACCIRDRQVTQCHKGLLVIGE
jgi:hypothetical protein